MCKWVNVTFFNIVLWRCGMFTDDSNNNHDDDNDDNDNNTRKFIELIQIVHQILCAIDCTLEVILQYNDN